MKTDICLCSATRIDHELNAAALAATAKDGRPRVVNTACGKFRLDRRATQKWDQANPYQHTCLVMTGCRTCGQSGVTFVKDKTTKQYQHMGCPGPALTHGDAHDMPSPLGH